MSVLNSMWSDGGVIGSHCYLMIIRHSCCHYIVHDASVQLDRIVVANDVEWVGTMTVHVSCHYWHGDS